MTDFEPCSTWAPDFVAALRRHYSGSRGAPPGRKLAWRVREDGRTVGWVGLGEPAFRLAPRRLLGIVDARPDPRCVCCFVARFEGPRTTPASAIVRAWLPVAAAAWAERYGFEPQSWETLVARGDARNLGACFKRAGFRAVGWTTGRGARRSAGATHAARLWSDGERKLLLYRGPRVRLAPEELADSALHVQCGRFRRRARGGAPGRCAIRDALRRPWPVACPTLDAGTAAASAPDAQRPVRGGKPALPLPLHTMV